MLLRPDYRTAVVCSNGHATVMHTCGVEAHPTQQARVMAQTQQTAIYSWTANDLMEYFTLRQLSERIQSRAREVKLSGYNLVNTPRMQWKLLFPRREDRAKVLKLRTEILRCELATRVDLRHENDIWTMVIIAPNDARILIDLPSSAKLIHLWRLINKHHQLQEGTRFRTATGQLIGSGLFNGDIRDQHTMQEYGLKDGDTLHLVMERQPLHMSSSGVHLQNSASTGQLPKSTNSSQVDKGSGTAGGAEEPNSLPRCDLSAPPPVDFSISDDECD